jgi:hypothetical protein
VETRFQDVRDHLGVETHRQWSNLAILHTTRVLLRLFSLTTVRAEELTRDAGGTLKTNAAAWYCKQEPTFSDTIGAVCRVLWAVPNLTMSRQSDGTVTIAISSLNRVL